MPLQTQLGEMIIEFVVGNADKVEEEIDQLEAKTRGLGKETDKATSLMGRMWDTIKEKTTQVKQAMETLASGGFAKVAASSATLDQSLANLNQKMKLTGLQEGLKTGTLQPLIKESVQLEQQMKKVEGAIKWEQLKAQHGTLQAGFMRTREVLDGWVQKASQVTGIFARMGAISGGIAGLLARGGSSNTIEGDRLARSIELLTRAVADGFAPVIRQLTGVIATLAGWFRQLDFAVKQGIANWLLIGAAVGGFVALLPTVIAAVGGLVTAIGLILTPVGLVVTALAVVGGAMLAAKASTLSWTQALANVAGYVTSFVGATIGVVKVLWEYFVGFGSWLLDKWPSSWSGTMNLVWQTVKTTGDMIARFFKSLFQFLTEAVLKFGDQVWESIKSGSFKFDVGGIFENAWKKSFGTNFDKEIAAVNQGWDKLKRAAKEGWGDVDANIAKADAFLSKIKAIGAGGGFKIKMDVQFESLQGTFDRLQKAFASGSAENLQEAQLGQLQQINDGVQKMAAGVVKMGDKLPEVQ